MFTQQIHKLELEFGKVTEERVWHTLLLMRFNIYKFYNFHRNLPLEGHHKYSTSIFIKNLSWHLVDTWVSKQIIYIRLSINKTHSRSKALR